MSQSAILLLAHGTPNRLSEMSDYLQHVTGGRPMPRHVIAELQHRYAEIGLKDEPLPEGPPLTHWTLRQAELLEKSTGTKVYVGMRNWHPFIAETVAQMRSEGITVLLVEQNVRMSLEIADHAYVLDDGQVVYSGPARELAADEARVQSLAGASAEEWTPHA